MVLNFLFVVWRLTAILPFKIQVTKRDNYRKSFITITFFLSEITSEAIMDCMERFSASSNARLSNLAKVFLQVNVTILF